MSPLEELQEYIDTLRILDTHEHFCDEHERDKNADVLSEWLRHYFSCDLVSAGLSPEALETVRDPSGDLLKRWKIAEPYWDAARYTGYGRSLDIAARGLYGIDGVNRKTIGPLNEAFVAGREKGGHYEYVLKDKSRITLSIVDTNVTCDRRYFASAVRMGEFIRPSHRRDVVRIGDELGVRVHSLDDWKEAMERRLVQRFDKQGCVALKCGLAYQRTLYFAKTGAAEAEREFNRLFAAENSPGWRENIRLSKAFEDHMMHHLLKLADDRGLPFQFHTGIQEGNGNVIADANPVHMTNLFLEYENVKFDIFHMGYPYLMELSNLAKNFRNVFIDMCWGHIISPEAARRGLVEWLDAVPANKISAFGGDYAFVDGVYGHQRLARLNVAAALARKIADGVFDLDRAKEVANWVFVDNPVRLFNLAERVKAANRPRRAARRKKKR